MFAADLKKRTPVTVPGDVGPEPDAQFDGRVRADVGHGWNGRSEEALFAGSLRRVDRRERRVLVRRDQIARLRAAVGPAHERYGTPFSVCIVGAVREISPPTITVRVKVATEELLPTASDRPAGSVENVSVTGRGSRRTLVLAWTPRALRAVSVSIM